MVALCVRLCRLFAAYPADFRRAYNPRMTRAFRTCCRGAPGLLAVWLVTLGDLVLSACAERYARVKAMLLHHTTRKRRFSVTIATTETSGAAAVGKGRMRAAIVVDLAVGIATIPVCVFCLAQTQALLGLFSPEGTMQLTWWSVLLVSAIALTFGGAALTLLARLAARGQTPGLALVGLRWGDATGRAAWRRLLGEPQVWCAALPALYILLACVVGTPQFFVALAPFAGVLSTIGRLIGPLLVAGALAIMVLSRKRQGRLSAA